MEAGSEIYQYLRDRNNRKIGVALALTDGEAYAVGVSVVNTNGGDKFNASQGIEMARGRAQKRLTDWRKDPHTDPDNDGTPRALEVPAKTRAQVKLFVKRCEHYFKDKTSRIGEVEANTFSMNFNKNVEKLTRLFEEDRYTPPSLQEKGPFLRNSLVEEAKRLAKIGQALEAIDMNSVDTSRFPVAGNTAVVKEGKP